MTRYVFVAGLHRTGTSLLTRLLSSHPAVAAISGSPAPEDEGCYLQGAIPHTALHGIPGHYALDPAQHHVEGSRYDTLETKRRLVADWNDWFPAGGAWRVEKSPVNLVRMRLYQQLFPLAHFIVILRHPEAMAAALAKWTDRAATELVAYALDAYDIVARDLEYLHAACVIRYEDLVRDCDGVGAGLFAFLDLDDHPICEPVRNGNDDYSYSERAGADLASRMARWGYAPGGAVSDFTPLIRHPLRAVRERTATLMSDGCEKMQKRTES